MEDKIRVLLTEEEVDEKIKKLGEKISEDYAGKSVHLICVLKGGALFMCELAKRITVPVSMDFMSVSSYGNGTESTGAVKIVKDLDEPSQISMCLLLRILLIPEIHCIILWRFFIRENRQILRFVHCLISRNAVWPMFMWIMSVLIFRMNLLSATVWTMLRNIEIFHILELSRLTNKI